MWPKTKIRDDLNPELRKQITSLGWVCENDDDDIGQGRTFTKPSKKGSYQVWHCFHNFDTICYGRAEWIKGKDGIERVQYHRYYYELMDAVQDINCFSYLNAMIKSKLYKLHWDFLDNEGTRFKKDDVIVWLCNKRWVRTEMRYESNDIHHFYVNFMDAINDEYRMETSNGTHKFNY